ncbi:septum site-determining protein MinC [Pelomonas sp. SE-A7]|uniref:septum site-determining protein MinC n=1 Tax=Pelomonas sp. SE-A7 TaxID=3054953 RepID=UPI00259D094F|nr:septum site-determining protein MinC [Pelomonas sp. SE-A7]MDM4764560.1 septum site-determining protein MinC [Pelomonas sp. SE-A7]
MSGGRAAELFELKSASVSLLALVLRSTDLEALSADIHQRLDGQSFEDDGLLIDLSQLPAMPAEAESGQLSLTEAANRLDLAGLLKLLREYKLRPVAVAGANEVQREQALALGLVEAPLGARAEPRAAEPRTQTVVKEVVKEVVREVVREVPAESPRTVVVDKPLRSGQQVYAKGADLVVMALVNHGAEVIADGHIHVYAPLRGKAIAGARGNTEARIFAASLEAELIAIAGIYRTTENPLPADVFGKPAQVRLDGEKLVMEALKL